MLLVKFLHFVHVLLFALFLGLLPRSFHFSLKVVPCSGDSLLLVIFKIPSQLKAAL